MNTAVTQQQQQSHLQNVQGSQLGPAALLWAVHLGALDDDCVRRQVDSPGQSGRGHQHLDVAIGEQVLHQRTVHAGHAGVVDGEAVGQQVLQLQVLVERARERKRDRVQA